MRVRFRVDGVVMRLHDGAAPRSSAGLVSRVKIMADLDIAERRVPQDGRIGLHVDGRGIDLRVATLPVMRGEAVVMRILDKGTRRRSIDALGMGAARPRGLRAALVGRTHGAILVTGPTGVGQDDHPLRRRSSALNTPDKT